MMILNLKLKPSVTFQNGSISTSQYTLHQAKGDAKAGHRKQGYLMKRSEGRLRNVWQRRRCEVRDGFLKISHADENKTPSQVNLLTCQMKPVLEELWRSLRAERRQITKHILSILA